jgi:hypothetical protein
LFGTEVIQYSEFWELGSKHNNAFGNKKISGRIGINDFLKIVELFETMEKRSK